MSAKEYEHIAPAAKLEDVIFVCNEDSDDYNLEDLSFAAQSGHVFFVEVPQQDYSDSIICCCKVSINAAHALILWEENSALQSSD